MREGLDVRDEGQRRSQHVTGWEKKNQVVFEVMEPGSCMRCLSRRFKQFLFNSARPGEGVL